MFDSRPRPKPTSRGPDFRGENNPAAKMTRAKVLLLRKQADRAALHIRGERRRAWPRKYPPGFIRGLATAHGIAVNTVYDILSRKLWPHV